MINLLTLGVEEQVSLSLGGQLRGIGVVVFAIILFCGSVYLLLATDVGGKLGFLIAFSALTGFISMLAMIWSTSQFPLNSLHGPPPAWKVSQVTPDLAKAEIGEVRRITEVGQEPEPAKVGEIKAAVDFAVTAEGGEFQTFNTATEYLAPKTYEVGGGGSLFSKKPHYAVVEVRPVLKVEALPGAAPPKPRADPDKPPVYVILVRDLGALRLPQYVTVLAFGILFVLSLIVLHREERGRQSKKDDGALEPAPAAPTPAHV